MKKFISSCLILILPSLAIAQSNNWQGFYGQVGVGYESINTNSKNTSFTPSGSNPSPLNNSMSSINGFTGTISAGYNQALNQKWLLGFGVDYSPLQSSSASYTLTDPSGQSAPISSNYKKSSGSYALYISPSYVFDKDKLAYAKLGYAAAQLNNSYTKVNHTGYLLGLGYKQLIQGGLYAFGEANYSAYGDGSTSYTSETTTTISGTPIRIPGTFSSTTNFTTYNFLVGIGYKF